MTSNYNCGQILCSSSNNSGEHDPYNFNRKSQNLPFPHFKMKGTPIK